MVNVGILSIGVYLPPEVRTNDWWPSSVVEQWSKRNEQWVPHKRQPLEPKTEGERRVLEAIAKAKQDPFCGARERRVADPSMRPTDLQILAAKDALERARLQPKDIDLVFTSGTVPDYLAVADACRVHEQLGVGTQCISAEINAACNSFHAQMALAQAMITSGQAKHALLVQSSVASRIYDYDLPSSPWFGDAATAVVVGAVGEGEGVLSSWHGTDGELFDAVAIGVPGGNWYDEGRLRFHARDKSKAPWVIVRAADVGRMAVQGALERAKLEAEDVDFYATHQATCWFSELTKEFCGLQRARTVDTFPFAGNVISANVPLVLAMAERDRLLRAGDIVATYSGGSGITWSSFIMRWTGA